MTNEQYDVQPGVRLAAALRSGWLPPALAVPFPLQPGEACVGITDGQVDLWLPGEGTYVHKSVSYAGGLTGLAIGGMFNAIGNSRRRSRAAQEAAERWRQVDAPRIFVTTHRFAMQGRQWSDLWYSNIRTSECYNGAIVLEIVGNAAMRIRMWPADYWFVLLRRLAYNEIYCPVPRWASQDDDPHGELSRTGAHRWPMTICQPRRSRMLALCAVTVIDFRHDMRQPMCRPSRPASWTFPHTAPIGKRFGYG